MERQITELPPINMATLAELVRSWNARGLKPDPVRDAMFRSWHYKPGSPEKAPVQDRFIGDMMWENPKLAELLLFWQDILGRGPQDLYGLGLDALQQRNR